MAQVSHETGKQVDGHILARQCQEAIKDVTFPDLATRQLFEALIKNISTQ